jgi:hypothetical protein
LNKKNRNGRQGGKSAGRFTPPKITIARELIERLRNIDLETADASDLYAILTPLFRGLKVKLPFLNPGIELFRGSTRFRSPPQSVVDFEAPPPELCPTNRANRAARPLFYCSAGLDPLPLELGVTEGTLLAIMKYRTNAQLLANRVGYTDQTFARLRANRKVPDFYSLDTHNYSDTNVLIMDFLSDVFCESVPKDEQWRYALSIAIAEHLIGEDAHPISGLVYPTVPYWGNGDNLALRPEWARTHLDPVHAQFIQITSIDEQFNMHYETLDEARSFAPDGTIAWLGHAGAWTLDEAGDSLELIAVRGKYFEARDALGRPIDPE